MELIRRWHELDEDFPGFAKLSMVVSCEQAVEDISEYVSFESPERVPRVDKEHALVCVNVIIDGRPGVILADPGYHVAQVITVMLDEAEPHTEWVVQTDVPECRKEFYYKFNAKNHKYIEWHEIKYTGRKFYHETSLVYVAKPYLEGIDVTIRRNLVYEFRSILARADDGHLVAGVYFKIRPQESQFTLLIDNGNGRRKSRHDFALFAEGQETPEELKPLLGEVNSMLGFEEGELVSVLQRAAKVMADKTFIVRMLEMNDYIQTYTLSRAVLAPNARLGP